MCPHCHKDAPVVHRGIDAYCTACGKLRSPFATSGSVTLAGKPAKFGGRVARWVGIATLVFGTSLSLSVGALLRAIFDHSAAGYVVGGAMELAVVAVGWALVGAGRSLSRSGEDKALATHKRAALALASHHGGFVTAKELAASTSMSESDAEQLLTGWAKTDHEQVSLEFNDDGVLYYRFRRIAPELPSEPIRVRVRNVGRAG